MRHLTWEHYERSAGESLHCYLRARGKSVNPSQQDKWLARLGIGWAGGETKVATARAAARRFDELVEELGVPKHERIRLGVPYRTFDGWGYACADQLMPDDARPTHGGLPDHVFYRFLAEGVFVLGGAEPGPESKRPDEPRMPVVYHDLGSHGTGLLDAPELHGALRRLGAHFANPRHCDYSSRGYDAVETMAYVPERNRAALQNILLPRRATDPATRRKAVIHVVEAMSAAAQSQLAQRIQRRALPLVLEVGGAARDRLGSEHSIVLKLQETLNKGKSPLSHRIADVHLALDALAKLDPNRWVDELIDPHSFQGGALQELFTQPHAEWSLSYRGRYK